MICTATALVDGTRVFYRTAEGRTPQTLYLHGNPTNSDDWLPFLARIGGVAPDLPGFGRSDRPRHFDYSIPGYDRFIEEFLDELGLRRVRMVVHDWGRVGLAFAQRRPDRVERLVIMNTPVGVAGYRWHRWARAKPRHQIGGTVNGMRVRGTVEPAGDGHGFTLGPAWQRDCGLAVGDTVTVDIEPEGPQRSDLAAALDAHPKRRRSSTPSPSSTAAPTSAGSCATPRTRSSRSALPWPQLNRGKRLVFERHL